MVPRRGALTLLKILLLHRSRPVHRDTLMELLWPEDDPRLALNRLYLLVHTLRRVVEPEPQRRPWAIVANEGDRYYLRPDAPYRLDVQEFEELARQGERLEREGDRPGAARAYAAAADLYGGDLFEDDPFAQWCWEERETLRERYLGLVERLGALYLEEGEPERAAAVLRRGLRADALREHLHLGLIRALWAAGRPAEALRQYEVCREVLRRELGIGPGAEAQLLAERIRAAALA